MLEKYKLKTNVIGINLERDIFGFAYEELERRATDRYMDLFDDL